MTIKMEKEYDYNSYSYLRSKQACEFCDQEFHDGYSYLVHNASHLLIPLMRQTVYCCDICDLYFTTRNDYNEHTNKHVVIKEENNIELNLAKVKLEKSPESVEPLELKQESIDIEMDSYCSSHEYIDEELCDDVHTVDKIKYEDDFDLETLKQFTAVKDELYTECYNGDGMYGNKQQQNGWGCEEPAGEVKVDESVSTRVIASDECRSVHSSELKMAGQFICRLCGSTSPNRFRLVLHETKHLRLVERRSTFLVCVYCDRYIAGNYRNMDKHLASQHDNRPRRKRTLYKCKECRLPYRKYPRHVRNYHQRKWCSWEGLEGGRAVCGGGGCCRTQKTHERRTPPTKKKILTNVDRLRNIQLRLMRINKLRKFCDDFYYIDRLIYKL